MIYDVIVSLVSFIHKRHNEVMPGPRALGFPELFELFFTEPLVHVSYGHANFLSVILRAPKWSNLYFKLFVLPRF